MKVSVCSLVLLLALPARIGHGQSSFRYSTVRFENYDRVDLEKARREYDGNVFIFFYKADHPALAAADSIFLADERISKLLNEKYARSAIDLDSDYAKILLSQVEIGGPTDMPFVLLLNLERPSHQGMWHSWDHEHPLPGVDEMRLDRVFWNLSNFAEYGTISP